MIEFKFPDVGEGIESGTLVKWNVKEGDAVKADEPLAEIETDKAVVELPSPATGTVAKINVADGATIKVGEVLVVIDESGKQSAKVEHPKKQSQDKKEDNIEQEPTEEKQTEPKKVEQPKSSESHPSNKQDMGTVIGTIPEYDEKVPEFKLSNGKTMHSLRDFIDTFPTMDDDTFYHHVNEERNDFANWIEHGVGNKSLADKLWIVKSKEDFANILKPDNKPTQQVDAGELLAMPGVRKAAKGKNIDLAQVKASGNQGQVTMKDLDKTEPKPKTEQAPEHFDAKAGFKIKKREYDLYGYMDTIPFKGIRKATADHMAKAWQRAPMVTHMDEIDVTSLAHLRQVMKSEFAQKDIKLTFLPFIVKATIEALKKYPALNAHVDDDNNAYILKHYINMGIAVDTPDGLLVPNIKIAQDKDLESIAKEIMELALKAKDRKLNLAEMKGGTFTITNVGAIGGTYATPILNYPETGILLLGRIMEVPRVIHGVIKPRKILPVSVTFDHRVLDGAQAARFTNELKKLLENPSWLA